MNNKDIWRYCISLLLLTQTIWSQESPPEEKAAAAVTDSIAPATIPYTLRFGVDLYRLVLSQASPDFSGQELVSDLRVYNNFYAAIEIGNESKTKQYEEVNITAKGSYFKLGFDLNMYENWEGMNNQVYLGLRYARSVHQQQLNAYTILDRDPYWPRTEVVNNFATGNREGLNASWVEVMVGTKVQVLKNVYLGFSARMHVLISDKIPENFDNIYIPGFNKKTTDNKFGASFNYSLTYSIPFLRTAKKKKD